MLYNPLAVKKITRAEFKAIDSAKRNYARLQKLTTIACNNAPLNWLGEPDSEEYRRASIARDRAYSAYLDCLFLAQNRINEGSFGLGIDMVLGYKNAMPTPSLQAKIHVKIQKIRYDRQFPKSVIIDEEADYSKNPELFEFIISENYKIEREFLSTTPPSDAELARDVWDRVWFGLSLSQLVEMESNGNLRMSAQIIDLLRFGGVQKGSVPIRRIP